MKKNYETTFIVNASIDDEQIENTIKQVEDLIVKNGGEILGVDRIGRRRLAYPIAKKHQGYYTSLEFKAEGRIVDRIERFYQLDENVLRYLTLQLSDREMDAKHQRIAALTREEPGTKEPAREEGTQTKPEGIQTKPEGTQTKPEGDPPSGESED